MAWTATEGSHIFRQTVADVWQNTVAIDLDTDVPKVALFGNTGTPDRNVTAALSAYNAATSQWVVANEKSDTNWAAGGRPLVSAAVSVATADTMYYDAADTAGAGNVTLAAVFGCLVYDDTIATPVADQGLCFNYFGGTQSVTAGTFTVIWPPPPNGIFKVTV